MIVPGTDMVIEENTTLVPGVYYLPNGIRIAAPGVTLDGNGAVLLGKRRHGSGVRLEETDGVTIKNLRLREYEHAIYARKCADLVIENCQCASGEEVAANTVFLDIWRTPERAYGGGIFLWKVTRARVTGCDLQHLMSGLLAYDCRELAISNCNASYSSGWGFLLNRTHDSVFEDNYADYCCRWEPRPALGARRGHLGADAAGFLLIGSHRNAFRRNLARLGGDGFFLAGLSPEWELMGCDDNLFEDNDVSHSPNNGFEATFTRGNVFRRNTASACNYGFWLGFSRQCVLEENQVHLNRRAGVGVENGIEMQVKNCAFNENQHGILLWSKRLPDVEQSVPENDTSRDWLVEGNSFRANWTAIRIAANQDHGVRPLPASGEWGLAAPAPCRHSLSTNIFEQNRLGIELEGALETGMAENRFSGNDEDVRQVSG